MADLRGEQLKDSYQNVVTRGTGNKLENGNGVEFADLDDKASLSGTNIQTVSVTKKDAFSESMGGNQFSGDVTGLTPSITPKSTTSKILVIGKVTCDSDSDRIGLRLFRNGIEVGSGEVAGDRISLHSANEQGIQTRPMEINILFLDEPETTEEASYSVRLTAITGSSSTVYVNRAVSDADANTRVRSASTITLMEIG